jgi:hypothetical protein
VRLTATSHAGRYPLRPFLNCVPGVRVTPGAPPNSQRRFPRKVPPTATRCAMRARSTPGPTTPASAASCASTASTTCLARRSGSRTSSRSSPSPMARGSSRRAPSPHAVAAPSSAWRCARLGAACCRAVARSTILWRRFAESSVVSIGVEHRLVELVHGDPDVTAGAVLADPAAGADVIPDIRPREGCFLMRRHDMAAAMPRRRRCRLPRPRGWATPRRRAAGRAPLC